MHDLTPIIGFVLVVFTLGVVARMVIRAVADNAIRLRGSARAPLEALQEQRMAQMEAEIASLRDEVGRLSAVETFYKQLQAPSGPGAGPPPGGPPAGPQR